MIVTRGVVVIIVIVAVTLVSVVTMLLVLVFGLSQWRDLGVGARTLYHQPA
jgi:hypothetical protein